MAEIHTISASPGQLKVAVKSQTEHLQSWWRRGEFYEQSMLEWIHRQYSGGVFVDVGSSIGNHTLFFAAFCDPALVVSVEPVRSSLDHQRENLHLNNLEDKVRLHHLALSDSVGRGRMELQAVNNVGMFQLVDGDEVQITTLDGLGGLENVTLVKIDAEWHEIQILEGAQELLARERPALFMELASEQAYAEAAEFLSRFGYRSRRRFNVSPTYEFVPRPVVSVCMIVKDEEDIVTTAVESTKGLADELVVVDTGSEDGTVPLLSNLGAEVIVGGDPMHKGRARNAAQDAAHGDWVVVLDADERIADPVGLRRHLETTDAQALFIRLAFVDGAGQPTLTYPQMRVWQRGTFEYRYRAHEVPVPTDGWGKTEKTVFVWEHRPPRGRAWKTQYTLDRLLLDVQENPGEARPLYYLGRQYVYAKEWELGIEILKKYLEIQGHRDRADAWLHMANCYKNLGNQTEQIRALFQACAENPMRRDWWGALSEIYHERGDDVIAVGLLKCALEVPLPDNTYAQYWWHGPYIYDLLARCMWKLGRYEEGRQHAARAVELAPDDRRLKNNLGFFDARLGEDS